MSLNISYMYIVHTYSTALKKNPKKLQQYLYIMNQSQIQKMR